MLLFLSINNIAVIKGAQIELGEGLNILTGETGAGKSIVIDSVNLALGERADKSLIRTGADKATIDAVFDITNCKKTRQILETIYEIEDTELIVRREMSLSGRNVCRINSRIVTLAQLREVTASLIDIHGQHQHQSLLDEANHLKVIDGFCGAKLLSLKKYYFDKYSALQKIRRTIKSKIQDEHDRLRQIEMYEFQIKEIDDAALTPDEDVELLKQREILQNSEEIKSALKTAYEMFSGGLEDSSILTLLSNARDSIEDIADIDESYKKLLNRMNEAMIELEDVGDELSKMDSSFDFNFNDIDSVESRLSLIKKLSRKYGDSVNEILAYKDETDEKLYAINEYEIVLEELAREEDKLYKETLEIAVKISDIRKASAVKFKKDILKQLNELGMRNSMFETEFSLIVGEDNNPKLTKDGIDIARFLISTNVGEALKPLSSVVSGGELSRIMLILKSITAQIDDIDTLIFDEIDTGISGEMARVVGEKLCKIGLIRQVICVTHSAQIAAFADSHIFITKQSDETSTNTMLQKLGDNERYIEISRLIGGNTISPLSDEHAKQIIDWSNKYKKSL